MSLWDWVLAVYERPGVPETCLKLQDEYGQVVSFLLWAYKTRAADPALLGRAVLAVRAWDETALSPLRDVRRALKAPCPPVADAEREGLRAEVKAAELHAERVLVDTLERLGGAPGQTVTGLAALTAASRAFGDPPPVDALASLAAALE
jgi:uncharacterized protein (TIGR02444 family)